MEIGWVEKSALGIKSATPIISVFLLVVASVLPWHLPGLAPITPAFSLIAIYFWAIYRPDKLPYAATFFAGILQDILSGGPLGMTALVMLLLHGIVSTQRNFLQGKPFYVVWWGFSLLVPLVTLIGWGVASLYFGLVVPIVPLVMHVILTLLLYPFLSFVLVKLQNSLLVRI